MNPLTQRQRSFWPWAIGGYFAIAILGIVSFVGWTMSHKMELVRADYYEHEILFQRQIDAKNRTAALGSQVAITFDHAGRSLKLRLPATHVRAGLEGTAQLYRPSDSRLDQKIRLDPDGTGKQTISANLAPGLWRIRMEWMANSNLYFHEQTIIAGN
jgi:nitrogen fixation protein FixH